MSVNQESNPAIVSQLLTPIQDLQNKVNSSLYDLEAGQTFHNSKNLAFHLSCRDSKEKERSNENR